MVGRILRLSSAFGLLAALGSHLATAPAANAQTPPAADAPKQPAAIPDSPTVRVRVGEHGGFDRIVFEWSSRVPYRVESKDGMAIVIFERPGRLDLSGYRDNPPPFFRSVTSRSEGKGMAVDVEIPKGTKLRHFVYGNSVVLDVLAPGTPKDAPAAGLHPGTPIKPVKKQTAVAPTAKPAN